MESISGVRGQGAVLAAVPEGVVGEGLLEEPTFSQKLKWYEKASRAKALWGRGNGAVRGTWLT